MALTKTQYQYIFFTALFIIAAIAIYLIFFNEADCDPNRNGYDKKGKPNTKCLVPKPNEPVPSGTPGGNWKPEVPPYNIGMYGSKIKALQKVLKIIEDGKFGNQTKSAIIAKGYTVPLSEADYNKIVGTIATTTTTTTTTGGGKTIDDYKGQSVVAKYDNTPVRYIYDDKLFKTFKAGEWIGHLGDSLPGRYHRLLDVSGDTSWFKVKIQDSLLETIFNIK